MVILTLKIPEIYTEGINLTSIVFMQFSLEPGIFRKNKLIQELSIYDVLMVEPLLRIDPTQVMRKNTKRHIQDLMEFAMIRLYIQYMTHKKKRSGHETPIFTAPP